MKERIKAVVFASGASVMVVEILASRIMAPYFGSSTYVWTAIIGVILAALSAGYYVGGRLADRNPTANRLSLILLASSALVASIPMFHTIVLSLASLVGLKFGSILSALILLAPSSFTMGMVSPYAIRLCAKRLESIGSVAGDLYAFSTLGSILGTFLTGFVLIPYFDVPKIFFAVSAVLFGCCLAASDAFAKVKFPIAAVIFFLIIMPGPPDASADELVYKRYSPYNLIRVEQNEHTRYLFLDSSYSGAVDRDSGYSVYDYIHYFELPFLMNPKTSSVLIAGEGPGVAAKEMLDSHPGTQVAFSEIDPQVHEVAVKFFGVDDLDVDVYLEDIRVIARRGRGSYDLVVLDAFNSKYTIPTHLVTCEFFAELKSLLKDDGIVAVNILSAVDGDKSQILKSVVKTMKTEYNNVVVFPLGNDPEAVQNVVVFAGDAEFMDKRQMMEGAYSTPVLTREKMRDMIGNMLDEPLDTSDAVVLSDDYSPADSMYLSMLLEL